jgi:multidrug efflux pump
VAQVDNDSAHRLGLTSTAIDNALYNAFGQRQVATIYTELNQYHVVMEWAPRYTRSPNALSDVYVPATRTVISAGQAVTTETAATAAPAASTSTVARNTGTTATATTTTTSSSGTATGAAGATAAAPDPNAVPVSANPGLRNASSGNVLSNTATSLVPLSAVAKFEEQSVATSVNHQDGELATTISFNLAEGANLGDARAAIAKAEANIAMPINVRGAFAGTAASAQQSQSQQAMLILAALVVIYIVLGMLYESLVHPITVLSTLPSAGVGAVLALLMFRMEFSIIALIGVFLLIGIVKKNAILIIDFALEAERSRGLSPLDAVREACLLRFRPILMTTMAAALGALPLAIGFGEGAELRRPLGVAIIGGLIASQLLTLLTTPVVYLLLDKLRRRGVNERNLSKA